MNVLIDSSLFTTGLPLHSGHGRIWTNLFRKMPADVEPYCNTRIRNLPADLAKPPHASPFPIFRPYRIGCRVSDWSSYVIEKFNRIDLLAPSLYVPQPSTLRLAKRIPLVTILDDLTPELVPNTMSQWVGPKKQTLHAATLIIAISESTKQLAMDHYGLPAEKFRVAPLASDVVRPDMTRSKRPHARPYFLVVGNRQGYKNFGLTLRAFARIAPKFPDVDLLLAGPGIADFERTTLNELGLDGRVHHAGRVDDQGLAACYAHSLALIYPSFSEGFGIPPLEAMICGTVAIASNRTSMPEVVGDAGLLIDPADVDSLVDAMQRVVENNSLRDGLVRKGLKRARLFSWDRTTKLIFEAWKEAARK